MNQLFWGKAGMAHTVCSSQVLSITLNRQTPPMSSTNLWPLKCVWALPVTQAQRGASFDTCKNHLTRFKSTSFSDPLGWFWMVFGPQKRFHSCQFNFYLEKGLLETSLWDCLTGSVPPLAGAAGLHHPESERLPAFSLSCKVFRALAMKPLGADNEKNNQ